MGLTKYTDLPCLWSNASKYDLETEYKPKKNLSVL